MKSFRLLFTVLVLFCAFPSFAQEEQEYTLVTGTVVDSKNHRMSFVNVSMRDSGLSTVTNEDGFFSLKIPFTQEDITLTVAYVGYYATSATVNALTAKNMKFILTPYTDVLDAGVARGYNPEELVRDALSKVKKNYPSVPVLQKGFYREAAQKGNRYISVSEAVVDIYKSSYGRSVDGDRVQVVKGRRLVSQKASDTLSVKLQGGPVLAVSHDVVKNTGLLFYEPDFDYYNFTMALGTIIGDRQHYVVEFSPRASHPDYPLYFGTIYIDRETLTISRVEFSMDMSDKLQVTRLMLRSKPLSMRFNPMEMSFVCDYRNSGAQSVLHYVRATIKFKCDWKKKFFSNAYTLVTEVVGTDITWDNKENIPYRDAFKDTDVFYDRVDAFYEPDFWGAYNIIEPSVSLEHAFDRLIRRAQ